jgi:N-acyl homoserine lactone hydrolase
MNTHVSRLFVLLCGFEILPKTVSTRGRGGRFILSEPVCAYLLDTRGGWVMLDAGMNPANGRDPTRKQDEFYSRNLNAPVIRDDHLMERQLAQCPLLSALPACAGLRGCVSAHIRGLPVTLSGACPG